MICNIVNIKLLKIKSGIDLDKALIRKFIDSTCLIGGSSGYKIYIKNKIIHIKS